VILFTIGFTKKTAEQFFTTLTHAGVSRVIDVRLNNVSQLAGFAKRSDLAFFLKHVCGIQYEHRPLWAPTHEILSSYKKKEIPWGEYETLFLQLLDDRVIETSVTPEALDRACLLCSEPKADRCHRRLVAERLKHAFPKLDVCHL
jgi:uncharacterized protein (DUF488 family)